MTDSPLRVLERSIFPLLFLLGASVLLRLPLANVLVWDWDESAGLVVMKTLLQGGLPYRDAFDNKGPLFYWLLAILTPDKDNIELFRHCTSIYLGFGSYCLYKGLVSHSCTAFSSFIAAIFFIVVVTYSRFDGAATNGEIGFLPFVCLAYWVSVRSRQKQSNFGLFVLLGISVAAGILIKPTAVFSIAPMVIFSLIPLSRQSYRSATAIFLGCLAVAIPCLYPFVAGSAISDLKWGVFGFNSAYMETVALQDGLAKSISFLADAMLFTPSMAILIVFCITCLVLAREKSSTFRKVLGFHFVFLLSSLAGAMVGRNAFPHYFLQLTPAIACFFAYAVDSLHHPMGTKKILSITVTVALSIAVFRDRHFSDWKGHLDNGGKGIVETVAFLNQRTRPGQTVYVLGGQPLIYYFINARPSTWNFFWINQAGRFRKIFLAANKDTTDQILAADYLVFHPTWSSMEDDSMDDFKSFILRRFRKIEMIEPYEIYEKT